MNILCLSYEFPPLGGGNANALSCLLKEFSKHSDLHIDVVTSSTNEYREENFSENIRIYFQNIGKNNKNLRHQTYKDLLTYAYKSYFFCKQLIRTNHYDLCHAFIGIPCGFIAMNLTLPYLVSLRGSDVPFNNPRFYWLDRLFFCHLSKNIWGKARQVIANSEGLKQLALRNSPRQDIDVIYNGVDPHQFKPLPSQSDKLRILCISRLSRNKGVEYLIKAMAQLPKEWVQLTVVGKGDQEEQLKKLTADLGIVSIVRFKEYTNHESIDEIYKNTDIFVLPSLNEGMSNALLEAMACGLPIVITDTGGTSELLSENGFVIKKKDVQSIVEALKKFLDNKELLSQMGHRSREITSTMSWQNTAQRYYNSYQSAIS